MMNNQGESIIACRVRLINQIRAADSDKDMFSVPSDDDGDLGLGYDQEMDFLMDLEVLCFIVSFTVSVVLIVFRKSQKQVEHVVPDEEGGDMDQDELEFDVAEQAEMEMNFDMDYNEDGNI